MDNTAGFTPSSYQQTMQKPSVVSIGLYIFITLITCGLFNLYWNFQEMAALNYLLDREEYNFWKWFFLTIITCGLYHIYYEYKMALGIIEIQEKYQLPVDRNLTVICVILSFFGLTVVIDAIQQNEINKVIRGLHSRGF